MSDSNMPVTRGVVVEEEVQFTLFELSRASHVDIEQLRALVDEGVLKPSGEDQQQWRFGGISLQRARMAMRLTRDLELSAAGVALVLELLDQIETLESRLRRLGSD